MNDTPKPSADWFPSSKVQALITQALEQARAEEREACAQLAEHLCCCTECGTGFEIAAAIRERGGE